ncbi:MAG: M1 family metallopeptidase [Armatimonadetes bacterium]|nr:M1 family metallopeptidase [Armatimonadota bacterium]
MRPLRTLSTLACALAVVTAMGQQATGWPTSPINYAPDRVADLQDVNLDLQVDYAKRFLKGTVVHSYQALQTGPESIQLQAAGSIAVSSIKFDNRSVRFTHDAAQRLLTAQIPALKKGQKFTITIDYTVADAPQGRRGFHWIQATATDKSSTRVGFWTQGQPAYNSEWVPIWDSPNDLATSQTRTTVQGDWQVIGNGRLIKTENLDGGKKAFTWKMTQPHATYLLALVGGPFDVKKDKWRGVDLWYVVPQGQGQYIDDTLGNTKDMLSYFSDVLGVKYAWPKYSQNMMFDFGGGMENVSSTTLGANAITEAREGYRNADSLLSHELAHQWFGDLVTCRDWGDTWLNESFATYFQILYFLHSRGDNAYRLEVDNATNAYLNESRRYLRPLSTKIYANASAMFDSHTYPKGGTILHTLRMQIGDEAFFGGLNLYLQTHRHQPVQAYQLCRAMSEASGINLEPFWDQWIFKPGHPVLDYTTDSTDQTTKVTIKQVQDTSKGVPIYKLTSEVAFSNGADWVIKKVNLSQAEETFAFDLGFKPRAIVVDPMQKFLREMKDHWTNDELLVIATTAMNGIDRSNAIRRLMATNPSVDVVTQVLLSIQKDKNQFPMVANIRNLAGKANPAHEAIWLDLLNHPSIARQADAAVALSNLPASQKLTSTFRNLINPKAPISVVVTAIQTLAKWDAKGNADVFKLALNIPSRQGRIKAAAEAALKTAN